MEADPVGLWRPDGSPDAFFGEARICVKYRIYFNRRREFPQVWSIDEGTQASEINVQHIVLHVTTVTRNLGSEAAMRNTDHDLKPFAWMECTGRLALDNGTATIYPADC